MYLIYTLFAQRSPLLIVLLLLFVLGTVLLISGVKLIRQNKTVGKLLIVLGSVLIVVFFYLFLWTILIGLNA
ncbi:MAG: hypothetical protein JJU16_11060 [Alkalibacterium sp.]|nr:hypothetical protein [Alkalibacterium sp.]